MVIYMIFDGFVQKYVLLEKLACDAYMPNAAKIHNATLMGCGCAKGLEA